MCTRPLKGFKYGVTKNGKPNYIITPYEVDHIEITANGSIDRVYGPFVTGRCKKPIHEFIEIPCGQCLECRLEYSRQWANRCILEAKQHKDNCFITLTYDDQNIPIVDDVDQKTGEFVKYKTLEKTDLQKFIKRLREHLSRKVGDEIKIRYFAAGEYGDSTYR